MHFAVCIILNNDTTYCCCLVQKEVEIFALMDIIFSCQTDHLSSLNGLLTKCHTENTASKLCTFYTELLLFVFIYIQSLFD